MNLSFGWFPLPPPFFQSAADEAVQGFIFQWTVSQRNRQLIRGCLGNPVPIDFHFAALCTCRCNYFQPKNSPQILPVESVQWWRNYLLFSRESNLIFSFEFWSSLTMGVLHMCVCVGGKVVEVFLETTCSNRNSAWESNMEINCFKCSSRTKHSLPANGKTPPSLKRALFWSVWVDYSFSFNNSNSLSALQGVFLSPGRHMMLTWEIPSLLLVFLMIGLFLTLSS